MSEPNTPPTLLGQALLEAMRQLINEAVREAVKEALNGREEDRLLDAEQAAELLGMSSYWVYRHAKKLPFTRKLGPKNLRFSYRGIQKFLATRKIP